MARLRHRNALLDSNGPSITEVQRDEFFSCESAIAHVQILHYFMPTVDRRQACELGRTQLEGRSTVSERLVTASLVQLCRRFRWFSRFASRLFGKSFWLAMSANQCLPNHSCQVVA